MLEQSLTLDAVGFEQRGWSLEEDSPHNRAWLTPSGDAVRLQLFPEPPPWPFDVNDLNGACAYYERAAAEAGGVMLSVEAAQAAGLEALRGVFKYRSPVPGSLGMYYEGILVLPFRDFYFQFNAESLETGTTGMREAAVYALSRTDDPTGPHLKETPRRVGSIDAMCDQIRAAPVRKLPSDDERYDAGFPGHPLTNVRGLLNHLAMTLRVEPVVSHAAPYRAGSSS